MKSPLIYIIGAALLGLLLWGLSSQFPGRLSDDYTLSHVGFLIGVLVLIGPGVVMSYRHRPGAAVRNALIWVGLLAAVFVLYTFRDVFAPVTDRLKAELLPSSGQVNAKGELEIIRSEDGHFRVDAYVNGQTVHFMVDTGASRVALSHDDAQRIGIDTSRLKYTMPVSTANGMTMNAYATLDSMALGPFIVEDVRASVAKPGQLSGSLLGMTFLDSLSGYRVEGDRLILWR